MKIKFSTLIVFAAVLLIAAGCARNPQSAGLPPGEQDSKSQSAPVMERELARASMAKKAEKGDMSGLVMAPPAPAPQAAADTGGKPPKDEFNTEEYKKVTDNPFMDAKGNPLSTFSIDVDTASYSNTRRFLQQDNMLPYPDAVRIEELVNYFPYSYPQPKGDDPVNIGLDMTAAPWNPDHQLLRVSLKAREIPVDKLPASNLVFLLDTSGSMSDENKLPLLQKSLEILVGKLRPQDKVAIVAYAGSAGLILPSISGDQKAAIIGAFNQLQAGGSTAGGEGIMLAYQVARQNFVNGGNNRVILCTDGDFNVGVSSTSEMERLIEEKRKDNIYLTVLGLGMGNYKDDRMETLADKGNGNYAYIDNLMEGKKVLGKEIWGNLFAVAKDVKIQIEFNPAKVASYRLIGYENRLLAKEDFNDDTKDAGEMGSGHTVTAFYELVLADGGKPDPARKADDLVFQQTTVKPSDDILLFRLRYKKPSDGNEVSSLMERRVKAADISRPLDSLDDDFRFASSVVEFGMLLRDSPFKGSASWDAVIGRAKKAKGADDDGYRAEFVRMAELAQLLKKN